MPKNFTVRSSGHAPVVYYGIQSLVPGKGQEDYIAIAWIDGEPDLWAIDNGSNDVLNELKRYYNNLYGRDPERIDIFDNLYKI